ncbi:hypothetical protein E2C01_002735 [Portunus trituberculatus]|uniref:Uncharacterized protein n=1 Tax=Portunus trituberculatus TaxID=210409 RepID=A0A5B7CKI9_PORTR|nr:hypothetical protein [Portunus trituberculatus]
MAMECCKRLPSCVHPATTCTTYTYNVVVAAVKSANSGVVGVVGKVGLALLGGTAGGVAKDRGNNFLPDICGGDMLRVAEVVFVRKFSGLNRTLMGGIGYACNAALA